MRLVSIQQLQSGMVLAENILSSEGIVLLKKGCKIRESYIRHLRQKNVLNCYIEDPLFHDVKVNSYLSFETKQKTLQILTKTFQEAEQNSTISLRQMQEISSMIVDELLLVPDTGIHLTRLSTYDDYTFAHCLNSTIYAVLLARYSGFPVSKVKAVALGALLHDIGKVNIPKNILNKPGKLTDDEFAVMKTHAEAGFELLRKNRIEISSIIQHMAWEHHEKVNGTGYPRQLKDTDILVHAKVLAIADVYEALTSDRPYRNGMAVTEAIKIIQAGLDSHFDEELAQRFLSKVIAYPPGTLVELNTGQQAIVLDYSKGEYQKPIVRVIYEKGKVPCKVPFEIDLKTSIKYSIYKIL